MRTPLHPLQPLRPLHRTALRPLAGIAGLALVLGGAAACGSDDPAAAPEDASQEDFCQVYADISADEDDDLDAIKDAVERLVEVGTPEDIPDEARGGLETLAEMVQSADGDEELERLAEEAGQEAQGDILAFIAYGAEVCADELDLPTEDDLGELAPEMEQQMQQQMDELDEQMGDLEMSNEELEQLLEEQQQ
ncbi:MAG: hypothetical protein ABF306_08735 [Nocardioides marinisabuli]|uniref:hypothetical protein n=1 Tax=Nocardioides marinisabuli TaxID=419476 RepID=UPI00321A3DC3